MKWRLVMVVVVCSAARTWAVVLPHCVPEVALVPEVAGLVRADANTADVGAFAALERAEGVSKVMPDVTAMLWGRPERVDEIPGGRLEAIPAAAKDGDVASFVALTGVDGQEFQNAALAFWMLTAVLPSADWPAYEPLQVAVGQTAVRVAYAALAAGTDVALPMVYGLEKIAAQLANPFLTEPEIDVWNEAPLGRLREAAERAEARGDATEYQRLAGEYLKGLGAAVERQRILRQQEGGIRQRAVK